tara:strand:- start:15040 stop:15348 length:309 start_codon:yes stop_codon:yes gene_type:complete
MKKDNDPRHEIAMAIDRVSAALVLMRYSLKDQNMFPIEDNTEELLAAIAFLNEAQRKVNATPDEPEIHPTPEWQNDAGEPLYNPSAEWRGSETDAYDDYLDR